MYTLLVTKPFRDDLDGLNKAICKRVPETIKQIEEYPQHTELHTHKYVKVTGRTIFRSRINESYHIFWE